MMVNRAKAAIFLVVATVPLAAFASAAVDRDALAAEAFSRGKTLFQQGDYLRAILEFERAHRAKPHFLVQCSIARSLERLSRMVEAARSYRACLTEGAATAPLAVEVRSALEEVERRITWLVIETSMRDGAIYVDGKARGAPPGRVAIDPGGHVVEIRRAGVTLARATLSTIGGEQRTLVLDPLERVRSAEKPASQQERGGARRRLSAKPFWSMVALTGALAATAVTMSVLTFRSRSSYEERPTEQGYQRFVDYRLATNILWGVTAASATTGTVLFFFSDFGSDRPGSRQAWSIGAGLNGAF